MQSYQSAFTECWYNKKTTRVPVLSHQTTWVKTYHLSAKREGDEFFTEGGLVNENSNEGGFLFIVTMTLCFIYNGIKTRNNRTHTISPIN